MFQGGQDYLLLRHEGTSVGKLYGLFSSGAYDHNHDDDDKGNYERIFVLTNTGSKYKYKHKYKYKYREHVGSSLEKERRVSKRLERGSTGFSSS